MKTFDIEMVLEAAGEAGFEDVAGGASVDLIWVGDWHLPPGYFKVSTRLYNNTIEIKPRGDNFTIAVYGWEPNKAPMIYKVTKTQVCDGKLDEFLVKFFENFDETYNDTILFLLDPQKMRAADRRISC